MANPIPNSYTTERLLDLVPQVNRFFSAVIFGVFNRILNLKDDVFDLINPDSFRLQDFKQITPETIEKGFYNPDANSFYKISNEKLHYLLDRTKDIAQKMGITAEIKVFSSDLSRTTGCFGSNILNCVSLFISPEYLISSNDRIDFIIAHELSHAVFNHQSICQIYSIALLVIEIVAAIFVTPFAIPIIEGVGSLFYDYISCKFEEAADQYAMRILNSQSGALECHIRGITISRINREDLFQIFQSENRSLYFEEPKVDLAWKVFKRFINFLSPTTFVCATNEYGEDRFDFLHPSAGSRVGGATAFRPSPA
jgi:hypothetical protein